MYNSELRYESGVQLQQGQHTFSYTYPARFRRLFLRRASYYTYYAGIIK